MFATPTGQNKAATNTIPGPQNPKPHPNPPGFCDSLHTWLTHQPRMAKMNAAVVTSFGEPPHYQQFEVPQPSTPDEMLVDVLAVGLHPRTRTGAAGAHYTSTGALPMIPGIDGVGRRPDGQRIYFVADDEAIGTMADQAVVDRRRGI